MKPLVHRNLDADPLFANAARTPPDLMPPGWRRGLWALRFASLFFLALTAAALVVAWRTDRPVLLVWDGAMCLVLARVAYVQWWRLSARWPGRKRGSQ
jgi:hypothetical protein